MNEKKTDKVNKQWGGRFKESNSRLIMEFNASVDFDKELAEVDIEGSIAHAKMLGQCKIITKDEQNTIVNGLKNIKKHLNNFEWQSDLEDVHMNIEAKLIQDIGEVGKKLHTARSRNDQVATDLRLYLRNKIDKIDELLTKLLIALVRLAEIHTMTFMPGFTHLQIAQPIVLAHHLLAWHEMLDRDRSRLKFCRQSTNVMPLGSAALAGTSFPIDRGFTAKMLNFDAISNNSLDSVSDRDFVIDFLNFAATLMMHLSRISEELILWSSQQFDFIELPDRYCTGSSIMPQKKNPDMPELIRGKTGRVYGNLVSLLTTMKAQPLAYNKDNQEDKEPLFDSVKTVTQSLAIYSDMIPNIKIKSSNMELAAKSGFSLATDLADFLVKKNVPFRDAHKIVGQTVSYAISKELKLEELTVDELRQFSDKFDGEAKKLLSIKSSVSKKNHLGGTAPEQVNLQIARLKKHYKLN